MGCIYCLFSTRDRDGNVRYVGKCRGDWREPISRHKSDALHGPYTWVSSWIREEWLAGYDVDIHVLERDVDENFLIWRENFWMGQFRDLLNERKRYYIGKTLSPLGTEHKQHCIDSIANIIDNYDGYHGIRYNSYREYLEIFLCVNYSDHSRQYCIRYGGGVGLCDLSEAVEVRKAGRILADIRYGTQQWPRDLLGVNHD